MAICRHSNHLVFCAALVLCTFWTHEGLARPFSSRKARADVNPFPTGIPTDVSDDKSKSESCITPVIETYENGSFHRIVNHCCEGYTGENCTEKIPEPSSGDTGVEFDLEGPCKGLVCEGVDNAQCSIIVKCGERLPVFLHDDGTIADCRNGQPVNVTRLTCTERCAVDPCKDATCKASPDAICVHTACNCDEPLWLRNDGVQVDCDTGEPLSPEEARRRRRRKREAESPSPSQPQCS